MPETYPARERRARVAVAAVVVALALALSAPILLEWGMYDRGGVARGEWWRLLSSHFAHFNLEHLLLNLAAWVLIWLYGWFVCGARAWVWLLAATTVFCGLSIHVLEPEVLWHGGLSGILHGLFLAVAMLRLRADVRDWNAWVALAALAGKLAWEWRYGAMPGTQEWIEIPVLTEAHLHGAAAGLAAVLPLMAWRRARRKDARKAGGHRREPEQH